MNPALLVVKGLDIGGVERIVVDLAVGLRRRGVPVEVAVVNERRDGLLGELVAAGVPVHALGGGDRVGLRAVHRLRALVAGGSFTVVHAHGPVAAVLCRLVSGEAPTVSTAHTPFSSLRRSTRIAWRSTASRDGALLAVSSAVAASLPALVRERVEVMPHGVDAAAVDVARAAHRRSGADGVVRAVTVARHRGVKNYPNLLRAVHLARGAGAQVELVAIGEGPELERHRRLAGQLGLADVVRFEPPVADVLGRLASADLLVVASDYEGQPLVVAEALAVGCPVVSTAVGRVPELVGPDVGRVVPPGRPDLLAEALVELARDPVLRQRMSAAALARSAVWTLDDVLDAHERLYRSVGDLR